MRPPQFESPAPPPPALPRFIPSPNLNETGPLDVRSFRPASPPRRQGRRREARVEPYQRGGGARGGSQGGSRSTRWDTPESSVGPMSSWSRTPSTSASTSASSSASASASPEPGPSVPPPAQLPPPTYPVDFSVS